MLDKNLIYILEHRPQRTRPMHGLCTQAPRAMLKPCEMPPKGHAHAPDVRTPHEGAAQRICTCDLFTGTTPRAVRTPRIHARVGRVHTRIGRVHARIERVSRALCADTTQGAAQKTNTRALYTDTMSCAMRT